MTLRSWRRPRRITPASGFIAEHRSACSPNWSLTPYISRASSEFQQWTARIVRAEPGYCIIVVISRTPSPQLQCNESPVQTVSLPANTEGLTICQREHPKMRAVGVDHPQFRQDAVACHRRSLTTTPSSPKLAISIDKGKSVARRRRKAMGPTGFARLPNREYGTVLGTATAAPWPRSTSCRQRQARFFRTRVGGTLRSERGFRVLHSACGRDSLPQPDDEA